MTGSCHLEKTAERGTAWGRARRRRHDRGEGGRDKEEGRKGTKEEEKQTTKGEVDESKEDGRKKEKGRGIRQRGHDVEPSQRACSNAEGEESQKADCAAARTAICATCPKKKLSCRQRGRQRTGSGTRGRVKRLSAFGGFLSSRKVGRWAPAARDGLGMVRALCGRKEESFCSANGKNERSGRETNQPGQQCDDTTGRRNGRTIVQLFNRNNHAVTNTPYSAGRRRGIAVHCGGMSLLGAAVDDDGTQLTDQASVYGKCIVADYNSVHKDKCAAEFMKLKNCYLVSSDAEECACGLDCRH